MATYADFTFYSTQYLGTAIAESAFPQLALKASAVIDRLTFGRVAPIVTAATDTVTIIKIKLAVCAVAEAIQTFEASGSTDGISSETVGSHSVTYTQHASKQLTELQKYINAARLWLDGTYLMFGGFNSGEYGGTLTDE